MWDWIGCGPDIKAVGLWPGAVTVSAWPNWGCPSPRGGGAGAKGQELVGGGIRRGLLPCLLPPAKSANISAGVLGRQRSNTLPNGAYDRWQRYGISIAKTFIIAIALVDC